MNAINWEQQFPIASINRADLTEFGFTDEQISSLFTDDVMKRIAEVMQESYHLKQPFWEDFRTGIQTILKLDSTQTTGLEKEK